MLKRQPRPRYARASRVSHYDGDMTSVTSAPRLEIPWWIRASRIFKAYLSLTKPRIIELLLATTLPTVFLASDGWPPLWLTVAIVIGGALSAGAANTFNSYLDRDIDAVMKRTSTRPLVTGTVSPRAALIFAWTLSVISTAWFAWVVDSLLAAALSVAAIVLYVVFYTMTLKRRTPQNIVWGGAAGCMPVLIAWAAVTQTLSWTPVVLFLIVFFWTPPHYWPLSMKFERDYRDADVPMLPVVKPSAHVAGQMIAYTVVMIVTTLVLIPVAGMTWIYAAGAIASGAWFLAGVVALHDRAFRGESKLREMRVFRDSIVYLSLVFAFVLVDPLVPDALTVWTT